MPRHVYPEFVPVVCAALEAAFPGTDHAASAPAVAARLLDGCPRAFRVLGSTAPSGTLLLNRACIAEDEPSPRANGVGAAETPVLVLQLSYVTLAPPAVGFSERAPDLAAATDADLLAEVAKRRYVVAGRFVDAGAPG